MNKYINILLTAGSLLPVSVMAQTELDALKYSQVTSAATARSLSLGGAGGSYGADFSSLSINPAGIGVYRSSEIMFTPVLRLNSMNTNYLGSTSTESNTKLNLANFGIVFTTAPKGERYNQSDWKAYSVGIGYNRVADFNTRGYYAGNNKESSITEAFAADDLLNGHNVEVAPPPYGYFAYWGFLDNDLMQSIPYENIIKKGGSLNQSKSWQTKGGINEWTLSLGGNFREKLLLGASVNLTSYKYDRSTNYYEEDATGNTNNDFASMSYNEIISTTGIGVNLKLGAIYVVNDVLRLGAAVHTPTWAAFSDLSDYNMTTNTEGYKASLPGTDGNPITTVIPPNQYAFDYSLRSPWRAILSATAFMGKSGFVTADYEYAAYNNMRYSFRNDRAYENIVNAAIKDTYKGTHNFRLGVEGKLQNYMGRVGFAYYMSPYQNADMFKGNRMDLSAGIGARFGGFFIDLAYVHIMQEMGEYGYPALVAPNLAAGIRKIPVGIADIKTGNNLVALTLGFKF
jgi:hypothetical protein